MYPFDFYKDCHRKIHFIGIGGVSMSAMAEILHAKGFEVSGSDRAQNDATRHLASLGITVYGTHDPKWIEDKDLIIYTDAVTLDNLELAAAISQKKDIVDRASFLGALMRQYHKSLAISGTHGKTTTTSMITSMIKDLPCDPTILLGGQLDDIHGNVRVGSQELLLTEACEYKANILKYFPTTATILNIDEDHLDFFDNIEHIFATFVEYMNNLPQTGHLLLNVDDELVLRLKDHAPCTVHTFSLQSKADYEARNIRYDCAGRPTFALYIHGELIGETTLQVMGRHNVVNALAAIATCHVNGLDAKTCLERVALYRGVHRRLEWKGTYGKTTIIDDYAHHPTEIQSALHALAQATKGRLICVFQPHTFTRTKLLLDRFATSFHDADEVIITDIYAAREKDYGDIHSRTLCDAITREDKSARYVATFEEIVRELQQELKPDDVLVTMGAGDVYRIGELLLAIK